MASSQRRRCWQELAKRNAAQWQMLGDGQATHALASEDGTGEIDLLTLGFELGMGRHSLGFRLVKPQAGDPDFNKTVHRGGQIQYNLYID